MNRDPENLGLDGEELGMRWGGVANNAICTCATTAIRPAVTLTNRILHAAETCRAQPLRAGPSVQPGTHACVAQRLEMRKVVHALLYAYAVMRACVHALAIWLCMYFLHHTLHGYAVIARTMSV